MTQEKPDRQPAERLPVSDERLHDDKIVELILQHEESFGSFGKCADVVTLCRAVERHATAAQAERVREACAVLAETFADGKCINDVWLVNALHNLARAIRVRAALAGAAPEQEGAADDPR